MHGANALLHISVFLFFWAISDFFYTVNHFFGVVSRYTLMATLIIYILLSISPLIFSNSPYNTPMTPPLRFGIIILRIIIRFPSWFPRWYRHQPFDLTGLSYYMGTHFDGVRLHMNKAEAQAEKLEPFALRWLFTENDFSNDDMDKVLEILPGYMFSSHTKVDKLDQYLNVYPILHHIKEYLMTCATSVELSDEARIARVSSCVKALLHIFQYSRESKQKSPDRLGQNVLILRQTYNQELMDHLNTLCGMENQTIGLYASCIRALAIQVILSQLAQDSGKMDKSRFPVSLIPFYNFLLPWNSTDGHTPNPEEMWDSFLRDGPLTNLTLLAQAVRVREHAPSSTLSFCWKALDILLTQLGTIHSEEPTPAQHHFNWALHHFNWLHQGIRTDVRSEEPDFRVTTLLDILDTVARRQRLLMLFSSHPKYHNRTNNVVFGKEYLRNSDLLEAFAHCLPGFISKNSPEVCRDFMESVIREDDLWTSLQVNLSNTQRSDSPTPGVHRVFKDCCTVVDIAFSVLEDSREVDWRSPEFGSLSQHWDSFIAHCFKGAFMGRATSFRVGVIKAQFCKALLAQFSDDIKKEGTVSFRSQWEIASFARLVCTLGLQDEENPAFWNSYVNGGDIGTEFTTKALEMIEITARDGPLLIFCLLGHLTAFAVPLDQSGLEFEDIEKVLELQRKVIDKERLRERLPLNSPSEKVWGNVGQMRKQIRHLLENNAAKDREMKILQELLQMIDDVCSLRSEGFGQGDPPEEQGRKTSVFVNLPSSSELRGASIQRSFASESTAVSGGGPSRGTPISEGEDGFGCANFFLILRASIDLQPDHSTDKVLDRERETYVRSDSPQRDELGSRSLPSPHATVPGTTGVGIMDRPTATSSSAVYFPYTGDARQRRSTTRRWTDSGFSGTRPSRASPVTRASTSVLSTSRRDSPTVLPKNPNPAIGSSYELFDLSDKGQLSAGSSSPLNRPRNRPCF